MFNVNEYVNELIIPADDEEVKQANDMLNIAEAIFDDGYLARANHWGVATAMENQISYLGGNLLPRYERRLNTVTNPTGVLAETDLRASFVSNEDHPHVNEDITAEEQAGELEAQIDQIKVKMRSAAIVYAVFVAAHDRISMDLNQLTFGAIKAKAYNNRQARSA